MSETDIRAMAYADGQLEGEAKARFEAEMAADPALAAAVAAQAALRARLASAYAPVLDEPVPLSLTLAATAANDRGAGQFAWRIPASIAASLAVGLFVGLLMRPATGPLISRDGSLVAEGALDRALTGQLASQDGAVKIGVSFRTADGGYCRTFQAAKDRLAGVACRDQGRWVARTVAAWSPEVTGGYRTAGAETPPPVLAAMDSLIAGAPLDAVAERAARDGGWAH